jgi:hypothetical protein
MNIMGAFQPKQHQGQYTDFLPSKWRCRMSHKMMPKSVSISMMEHSLGQDGKGLSYARLLHASGW